MKPTEIDAGGKLESTRFLAALLAGTAMTMVAAPAFAQDADETVAEGDANQPIVVSGIRASLAGALDEKRNADSLIEVIQAEDIGKLPDQNLAEVLENITGVQITREAGVGTGVQIRGTDDNRSAINGVTLLSSGTGRGTISFEDINAAIVSSVEVTKAPEASSIEGSVGGTINLRTIRPLDLKETLISARAQGEYSELSGGSITPRISVGLGKKWELGAGEFGIVLSGSYAEQEATSFRPRVDRDNLVPLGTSLTATGSPGATVPFLGIQFLNQELENFEYRTINFAGSLEWAPSDNLKFYFDGIYNDQERRQDSSRVQASGVGGNNIVRRNLPDSFETINWGSLDGVDLGSIEAALVGKIVPNSSDADDPNLRFSSDVGARLTTNQVYRLGTEFEAGRFSALVEGSISRSKTRNPDLSTTLNFINPNSPLIGNGNDNQVPFVYDLSNGLAFGIDFDSALAPTVAQLLDPANVVLQSTTIGNNRNRNAEDAFRIDASLDLEGLTPVFTSFDWGYRYNKTSSEFEQIRSGLSTNDIRNSPRGTLFADLLVPGPNNFGDADGRSLFFRDFILIDPNRAFANRDAVIAQLQAVIAGLPAVSAGTLPGLDDPSSNPGASFRVVEKTHAVYGQANFDLGILRGNLGLRWVDSRFETFGSEVAGATVTPISARNGSSHLLPRLNVAANLQDNLLFRASFSKDINRPDFNDLSLSVNFPATGQNSAVNIGNPDLVPEEVTSYDASLDWYFAPSSVISVGVFHKVRKNLFVTFFEDAATDANGYRDITPPCEGGGIFNPLPLRGVLSDQVGNGLCVPIQTTFNDTGRTKQTGIEVAFQYDLSQFEDTLGFASGFGVQANATLQKFTGGTFENSSSADTRANAILAASQAGIALPVTAVQGLLDFSKKAYNATLYYEKYGFSARARYTWRSAFRTLDTAGGATLGSTLGFPSVTAARGQLNAGINYDVTDFLTVGVEGVNLTKSKIRQYCVNDGALLCFEGLPDRRLTFGASIKF